MNLYYNEDCRRIATRSQGYNYRVPCYDTPITKSTLKCNKAALIRSHFIIVGPNHPGIEGTNRIDSAVNKIVLKRKSQNNATQ